MQKEGDKIRLPITEIILQSAASNLTHSKKWQEWTLCNAVLLPAFLTEESILNRESDVGELLYIFARFVMERAEEGGDSRGDDNDDYKNEKEDENTTNMGKTKQATAEILATIADNCDDVFAFHQAVAVKSPQVTAAPISLRADKRARVWLYQWADTNVTTPPKLAPQYHMGLTGVLTNVATRIQTA